MQSYKIACEGVKDETCYGACEKSEQPEKYNKRVRKALNSLHNQSSFIIVDDGLHHEEKSCILVEHGSFKGMGYISSEIQVTDPGSIKEHLQLYRENQFIRNIVLGYAARYPHKVIHFESETIITEG